MLRRLERSGTTGSLGQVAPLRLRSLLGRFFSSGQEDEEDIRSMLTGLSLKRMVSEWSSAEGSGLRNGSSLNVGSWKISSLGMGS